MLPDFPRAKAQARRAFLAAVRAQMVHAEPLLGEVGHQHIHEGRRTVLTRQDRSVDEMGFSEARAEVTVPREQMRTVTIEQLREHVVTMAEQFAGQQMTLMFSRIREAVDAVGNSVSATEIGNMEAFLEMQRRLEVEFDADTLEPKNMTLVVHPDMAENLRKQFEQWNEDPYFKAESAKIRDQQIEAWRARENRRRLVD